MKYLDRYTPEQARWHEEVKLRMAGWTQITAGDVGGGHLQISVSGIGNGGWRETRLSTLSLVAYKDK